MTTCGRRKYPNKIKVLIKREKKKRSRLGNQHHPVESVVLNLHYTLRINFKYQESEFWLCFSPMKDFYKLPEKLPYLKPLNPVDFSSTAAMV